MGFFGLPCLKEREYAILDGIALEMRMDNGLYRRCEKEGARQGDRARFSTGRGRRWSD